MLESELMHAPFMGNPLYSTKSLGKNPERSAPMSYLSRGTSFLAILGESKYDLYSLEIFACYVLIIQYCAGIQRKLTTQKI
jgi:hypothetical protein